MIEGTNPVPPKQQVNFDPAVRQREEAKLKDASKQFEQAFMTQLFKEMRKTEGKNDLTGESKDNDTWKEMLDQERAKAWSDSGGVGMAQIIYEQMKNQIPDRPAGAEGDPMTVAEAAPPPASNRKTDPAAEKD